MWCHFALSQIICSNHIQFQSDFQASHGRHAAAAAGSAGAGGDNRRINRSDRYTCTTSTRSTTRYTRSKSLRKVFGKIFTSGNCRRKCNTNRNKNGNGNDGVEEERLNPFTTRDEETATPWLPEHLHHPLALRLKRELFSKGGVRLGVEEDLDQYESAFEFAPAPDRFASLVLV